MPRINSIIPTRSFELIRDRIGEIIADEMLHQFAISYDEDLDLTVWVERSTPFDKTELPAVNVSFAEDEFSNFKQGVKDGTCVYEVDVYTRSKTTNDIGGDKSSTLKLHKIIGKIDAILSNSQYKTLGFTPGFIGHTSVSSIKIVDPRQNRDAEFTKMGRLLFTVRCVEETKYITPTIAAGFDTQVKLYETDLGYKYVYNV